MLTAPKYVTLPLHRHHNSIKIGNKHALLGQNDKGGFTFSPYLPLRASICPRLFSKMRKSK